MREQMLTEVIRFWGFEHNNTIEFATAMEIMNDEQLTELFNDIIDRPLNDEEEED